MSLRKRLAGMQDLVGKVVVGVNKVDDDSVMLLTDDGYIILCASVIPCCELCCDASVSMVDNLTIRSTGPVDAAWLYENRLISRKEYTQLAGSNYRVAFDKDWCVVEVLPTKAPAANQIYPDRECGLYYVNVRALSETMARRVAYIKIRSLAKQL